MTTYFRALVLTLIFAAQSVFAAPATPTNLTATVLSSTQVKLAWVDQSSQESGFRIERQTESGLFGALADVNLNVTAYSDPTVSPLITYSYRVRSYNANGYSSYSNIATITTPAAPTLTGLTYNNGDSFVDGVDLAINVSYTVTAQVNAGADSVQFNKDAGNNIATDSAAPFNYTWTYTSTGPHTLKVTPFSGTGAMGTSGTPTTITFNVVASGPSPTPTPTATPAVTHSTGNKKLIDIRVQFPDKASPITQAEDLAVLSDVNQRTQDCSYGRKSYTVTVTSKLYTLPHNSSFYESGAYQQLAADARQLVLPDFGDVHTNFDRTIYHFPSDNRIILGYQGYSIIGGEDAWLSGGFNQTLVMHEEGHNDGLHHAHRWVPANLSDPSDPNGSSLDYGDFFDIMGNSDILPADFNPYEKIAIGWLDSSKVSQATSGTHRYRIYRFDSPSANSSPLLGVSFARVSPGSPSYRYFVGYRANTFAGAPTNGAYIQWGLGSPETAPNPNTYLIDRIPSTDWKDAMWTVGSTFHDTTNGITIDPIQTGGTTPNFWIDVDITLP